MKRFVQLVLVLSVFALAAMAKDYKGYISDSKCGAKHATDHNTKCIESCIKGGASPVFVSKGKVYKIDDATKVQDHLGHDVTISGKIEGDTIHVENVSM